MCPKAEPDYATIAVQEDKDMNTAVISRNEEMIKENSPARPKLTAAELLARRQAADFARANVGLEGFRTSDPEYEALVERYVTGEFDLDEFLAAQGLKPSVYRI
jgi:hypothetical protein